MSTQELMTTATVARQLGISRQAVVARVHAGTLKPAHKIDTVNGTYLFEPAAIDEAESRPE